MHTFVDPVQLPSRHRALAWQPRERLAGSRRAARTAISRPPRDEDVLKAVSTALATLRRLMACSNLDSLQLTTVGLELLTAHDRLLL